MTTTLPVRIDIYSLPSTECTLTLEPNRDGSRWLLHAGHVDCLVASGDCPDDLQALASVMRVQVRTVTSRP